MMKDCRSTEGLRDAGAHIVAQFRDMLEIDGYELLAVEIRDRKTWRRYYWSDFGSQEGEKGEGDEI